MGCGDDIVKLSDLRDAAAGWLINDTLVLTVWTSP
jgi:hypothetical protein